MDWSPSTPPSGAPARGEEDGPFVGSTVQGLGNTHPLVNDPFTRTNICLNQLIRNVLGVTSMTGHRLPFMTRSLTDFFTLINDNRDMALLASYFGGEYEDVDEAPAGEDATVVQFFADVAVRLLDAQGRLPAGMEGRIDPEWDRLTPSGGLAKLVLADTIRSCGEQMHKRNIVVMFKGVEEATNQSTFAVPFVFRHSDSVAVHGPAGSTGDRRLRWGGVAIFHDPFNRRPKKARSLQFNLYFTGYLITEEDELFWLQFNEATPVSYETKPLAMIPLDAFVYDPLHRETVCGYFSAFLSGAICDEDDDDALRNIRQYVLNLVRWRAHRTADGRPPQAPRRLNVIVYSQESDEHPTHVQSPHFRVFEERLFADALPPAMASICRMVDGYDLYAESILPSLWRTTQAILETTQAFAPVVAAYVHDMHTFKGSTLSRTNLRGLVPRQVAPQSARVCAQFLRFLHFSELNVQHFFKKIAEALVKGQIVQPDWYDAIKNLKIDKACGVLLSRLFAEGLARRRFPFRLPAGVQLLQVAPHPFLFRMGAETRSTMTYFLGGVAYLCDVKFSTGKQMVPLPFTFPLYEDWWPQARGGSPFLRGVKYSTGRQLAVVFDGFIILQKNWQTELVFRAESDEQLQPFDHPDSLLIHFHMRLRSLMKGDARRGRAHFTMGSTQHNSDKPTIAMMSLVLDETDGARAASGDQ